VSRALVNPRRVAQPAWRGPEFAFLEQGGVLEFHRTLPGYEPTPLVSLSRTARELGVASILAKDESLRFGLKAFKALGASYAIHRLLERRSAGRPLTLCAATDGNHGRAVAWTARRLGQKAVIYMPRDSAPARVSSIRAEGAEVILVDGTFDDCVRRCAADARAAGMQAVSDTAYPGYEEIPRWIMLGYQSLFREMEEELGPPGRAAVDIVLLQAGVGGFAAAGASYYVRRYGERRPRLACVEPAEAACCLASAEAGERRPAAGSQETIMAGLSCGEVSPVAWPIVRDAMDVFVAIEDRYAVEAMRAFAREGIVSGESGAAGLAALIALRDTPELRDAAEALGLTGNSRVLVINTEGDTDPEGYRHALERGTGEARSAGSSAASARPGGPG
jgi:diaminopropionate ammonia-lyase